MGELEQQVMELEHEVNFHLFLKVILVPISDL